MKKSAIIILLAAVMVAMPSCKKAASKKAQTTAQTEVVSTQEQIETEALKISLQNLAESVKKMKALPFLYEKNGKIQLSNKEKMVKPDYLVNPSAANNMVSLSQKYRMAAMLSIDKVLAGLYEMPVDEIDGALSKILVDVNDPALQEFAENIAASEDAGKNIGTFFDKEIEASRANFFWETATAGLVEQVYVLTKNMDKFLPLFDDESAENVTYNFVCVHEGLEKMIQFYPEMESLQTILKPLYVINAISVSQLRDQLLELKGEIEVVREALLK